MKSERLGPHIAAVYELQAAWLEPELRKLGIRWNTFQLLSAVQHSGGRAAQVEIARRLGVTPATLSESVRSHVQAGLIEQAPSNADRRARMLSLTVEGRRLMDEIGKRLAECESTMMRGLSDKQLEQARRVLEQVYQNLQSQGFDEH